MRKLGELDVVGTCVRVYHATPTESDDALGEEDFGCYVAQSAKIYLCRWTDYLVSPSALWGVAVHEFFHAAFWETGAYLALKDACPKWTLAAREQLEERIISAISPLFAYSIATGQSLEDGARIGLKHALLWTDACAALQDACPDYGSDALERLIERLVDRLSRALASALPGLKQLHASIKKVTS